MPSKILSAGFLCLLSTAVVLAADSSHKVLPIKEKPKGLSANVTGLLSVSGYRVVAGEKPICEFWFVKGASVKPEFKSSLGVNYPFTPGQLVGALRVPMGSNYTDFRGQTLKPGVYTLRYAQQPQDGNHFAENRDFFLALHGKEDADPKSITSYDALVERSAKSVGTTHPAILSLLPADEPQAKASLSHDANANLWILSAAAEVKQRDKSTKLSIRFVVVGKSEE